MNKEGDDVEVIQHALDKRGQVVWAVQRHGIDFGLQSIGHSKERVLNQSCNEFESEAIPIVEETRVLKSVGHTYFSISLKTRGGE